MAAKTKKLVQTVIPIGVVRKFDVMALALGHTRASYLRYVVENHVNLTITTQPLLPAHTPSKETP